MFKTFFICKTNAKRIVFYFIMENFVKIVKFYVII